MTSSCPTLPPVYLPRHFSVAASGTRVTRSLVLLHVSLCQVERSLNLGGLTLVLCDIKISFHFSVYQVETDRTESQNNTQEVSRDRQRVCVGTRVRHMATRRGVWVSACVRAGAAWCTFLREQGDTHRSAGEGQRPRDAFVPTPLVSPALPQNCRSFAAHAFLRASLHQRHG